MHGCQEERSGQDPKFLTNYLHLISIRISYHWCWWTPICSYGWYPTLISTNRHQERFIYQGNRWYDWTPSPPRYWSISTLCNLSQFREATTCKIPKIPFCYQQWVFPIMDQYIWILPLNLLLSEPIWYVLCEQYYLCIPVHIIMAGGWY